MRLDLATRTWEAFEPFKGIAGAHQTYGIASDSKNNIYFMDFADKGIGIESVFSERVFLIFQRLNASEQFEGTGVGLALCKRIVANHKGEVYVDANQGAGVRFHIILPLPASDY